MDNFRYFEPESLAEATALLAGFGKTAALLAGGTDLLNHIRVGKRKPEAVVSLRQIKELGGSVCKTDSGFRIGALTTLAQIGRDPELRRCFPAICEGADKVGSKQIRNRATLAGNICNASPAADTVPGLLIYEAVVNIVGEKARRAVPAGQFMIRPGKTCLAEDELVESIDIPNPPPGSDSIYLKLSRREGVDLAIVGAAVLAAAGPTVRIALGAVGPRAFRPLEAERLLSSEGRDSDVLGRALELIDREASPISDIRAGSEYRRAMIKILTIRALQVCMERVGSKGGNDEKSMGPPPFYIEREENQHGSEPLTQPCQGSPGAVGTDGHENQL